MWEAVKGALIITLFAAVTSVAVFVFIINKLNSLVQRAEKEEEEE